MNVPFFAALVLIVVGGVLGRSRFKESAAGRSMPLVMAAGAGLLAVGSWLSHDLTIWSVITIVLAVVLVIANVVMWIRESRLRRAARNG
ncbi:hypothetical protein [Prescottella agglutinans]|uniref:Zn-dependent protease with chaperone function n=1 Tax=Prescottella agglutinans TaxID=1644129 RepID=A0ABT6ML22_9NOCA|nr:hypothetical protein [Prescottella agglutinans]MDH6284935.1 Zn-dependent protease with chaperone function [Prescottella agglutinans]